MDLLARQLHEGVQGQVTAGFRMAVGEPSFASRGPYGVQCQRSGFLGQLFPVWIIHSRQYAVLQYPGGHDQEPADDGGEHCVHDAVCLKLGQDLG